MMPPSWGPLLFVRSRRGLWWLAVLTLLSVLIGLLVPRQSVGVPFRIGILVNVTPLAAGVPAMMAGLCFQRPDPLVESFRWRLVTARALWWAAVYVVLTLATAIFVFGSTGEGAVVALRNVAILLAVATITSIALPPVWSWMVGLPVLGISMIYGTQGDAQPKAWALLQHPTESALAGAVAVVLLLTAWTLYAVKDTKAG